MRSLNIFPEEILSEILSRLPTESVLECKRVSKPWRNLVRHPSFAQLHLAHLNSAHSSGKSSFIQFSPKLNERQCNYDFNYAYTEYDENLNSFSRTLRIKLRHAFKSYYILSSFNGLICFDARVDDHYRPAYICNPITREYIMLPKVEGKNFLSGFGCVPSTNEYKVVSICNSTGDPNFGIFQVYTLGSGIGWRKVTKMEYDTKLMSRHGVFVNGAIYWVSQEGTIFAFDLAYEEIRIVPSPACLQPTGNQMLKLELEVLGDFLCALHKHSYDWDIWVFKKNGNNQDAIWSKEYSRLNFEPVTFIKNAGIICRDYRTNDFYLYAPKDSSSRLLHGVKFRFGVPHKNTLVSLKALGEENTRLMDSGERASSSGETESSGP